MSPSIAPAQRGAKQTCENQTCGRRFYDLKRTPTACPYCGESLDSPAVEKIAFETYVKPVRKSYRWVEPARPAPEAPEVDSEADEKEELEPSANEELLMDIDEEDGETPAAETGEPAKD